MNRAVSPLNMDTFALATPFTRKAVVPEHVTFTITAVNVVTELEFLSGPLNAVLVQICWTEKM
jgi:hypothetical protein